MNPSRTFDVVRMMTLCAAIVFAQPAFAQTTQTAQTAAQTPEPIGNVATLTGQASVTRNNVARPLKVKDDIFKNDILQTQANAALGVTFNDTTTFNLTANARIAVDSFVYDDGSKSNSAIFNIVSGTVAFAAAAVAKTGDMKISTPSATLGIRGTTGLIEVPEGAAANPAANARDVAIKLYPDADGKVGRIEVNGRDGARLGLLSQGASGFNIRPGAGGRFTALPLQISPQQVARDQGIVRQVHVAQNVGRQIVTQQRALRRANPNRANPARPNPALQNRPGAPLLQQRPANPGRPALQRRSGSQLPKSKPPKQRR